MTKPGTAVLHRPDTATALPRYSEPGRFRLGIAVPFRDCDRGVESDFLADKSSAARADLVGRVGRLATVARQVLGAENVRAVTDPAAFWALFSGSAEVVTLLAHSPREHEVELLGTRVRWEALVLGVPADFTGLIDLRGCMSEVGADALRRRCEAAEVIGHPGTTELRVECYTYAQALRRVCTRGVGFDRAAPAARRGSCCARG